MLTNSQHSRRMPILLLVLTVLIALTAGITAAVRAGSRGASAAGREAGSTAFDPAEEDAGRSAFAAAHIGGLGLTHPTAMYGAMQRAARTAAAVPRSSAYSSHWRLRGPKQYLANTPKSGDLVNEGFQNLAGRVTTLATTPKAPQLVWAGAADGGAWKSNNGGGTWHPMFDKEPTAAIGSIAIDPRNPDRVYVGTGEANTNADAYYGDGVFTTSNGGRTWHRTALKNVLTVFHVEVAAPSKGYPDGRVFAATNNGLWLSTDHGRHFTNLQLPTNATHNGVYRKTPFGNFVTDVRVRPKHASQVVAVVGWRKGQGSEPSGAIDSVGNGFYQSTASGAPKSFHFVPQDPTTGLGQPGNNANPYGSDDPIGRTSLAYSADGKYLWAVVQDAGTFRGETYDGAPLPANSSVLNGVYVSTTADPSSWTPKGNIETFASAPGSALGAETADFYGPGVQSWYDQYVAVDPNDDSRVLVGLEEVYEATANATTSAGYATWRTIARYWNTCALLSAVDCSQAPASGYSGKTTHPDQHAVAFVPGSNGSTLLYTGSDGGVFKQQSHATQYGYTGYDNDSWKYLNLGLSTTQPYYAAESSDGTIYAGLQDNGELKIGPGSTTGNEVYGGDGFDTAVVPNNSKQAYEEYTYGDMSVTTDGGQNWTDIEPGDVGSTTAQFSTPFVLDPKNSNHIVEVGRYIDESTHGVNTTNNNWTTTYDLGPSKVTSKPGVGGGGVNNVATAVSTYGAHSYVPFCGICDPISQGSGDFSYFHNGIATNVKTDCKAAIGSSKCWHKAKAKGLPNRYISGVAIDPRHPRTVYVALTGYLRRWYPNRGGGSVYVSHNAGQSFRSVTGNLPAVPANALVLRNRRIFVGTDLGLYTAAAGKTRWTRVGKGLPNASILDVRLNPQGSQLVAALHGRGVWTYSFGRKAAKVYRAHGAAH